LYKEEHIHYYNNLSDAFLDLRNIEAHPHIEVVNYADITRSLSETGPFRLNAYVAGLITDGSYSFVIDGREYEFKRGTLYFLAPWHTRSYRIIHDWKGYLLAFTPRFLSNAGSSTDISQFPFFSPGQNVVLSLNDETLEELTSLMQLMHAENKSTSAQKYKLLYHYIHILLHKCENLLHETGTGTLSATDDMLNRFQRHIHSYFDLLQTSPEMAPLSINYVADRMNLHPHYLSDIIKQKTGRTATQIIRERIAHEAQSLLTNTGKSISEIAYHLRFEDNSNFTKFFKAQMQVTPKEFREGKGQRSKLK
jgi:AraC family transcriptional activator of pobA